MTISEWVAAQGPWAYIVGSYGVAAVALGLELWLVRARLARAKVRA